MLEENTNLENTNQTDNDGRFERYVGLPPLNYNEIYLGDSFELCERVEAKTVDMVLEDMPYNTTACDWDVKIDLDLYWKSRLRILKPNGVIVLTASQPFTSELVVSNRKMFKYEWIWEKDKPSNFALANKQPMKYHENIIVFMNVNIYNKILWSDGKTVNRSAKYGRTETEITGGGLTDNKQAGGNMLKNPKSIQKFNMPNNNGSEKVKHPTQKPVGLFEYLIRTYTNEGDLVFDGFGGSGTTAIAAHKSKRNFIVIEKEKKYFDLAKRRLDNERAQLTML